MSRNIQKTGLTTLDAANELSIVGVKSLPNVTCIIKTDADVSGGTIKFKCSAEDTQPAFTGTAGDYTDNWAFCSYINVETGLVTAGTTALTLAASSTYIIKVNTFESMNWVCAELVTISGAGAQVDVSWLLSSDEY